MAARPMRPLPAALRYRPRARASARGKHNLDGPAALHVADAQQHPVRPPLGVHRALPARLPACAAGLFHAPQTASANRAAGS